MNLSAVERLLLVATIVTLAYRAVSDEWPIGIEVEPAEGE